jgi:hypothetical protein
MYITVIIVTKEYYDKIYLLYILRSFMKDYSKIFLEEVVTTARTVDKKDRNTDGSFEMKLSDKDIKDILGRERLRKGLKNNLIKDLESANVKASTCDSNSLCIIIPEEKLEKKIAKYSDIKKGLNE